MSEQGQFTPYGDVNRVLQAFVAHVTQTLDDDLVGIYLSGSLALGDFDPDASDIDLVVVTDNVLTLGRVAALRAMHNELAVSDSPWASQFEVVYVPRAVLRQPHPDTTHYPQVEKERGFVMEPLEDGWLTHCFIVREHGVTLLGPEPRILFPPVDVDAMRRMVAKIPEMWLNDVENDPTWLDWLRVRHNQSFVVLTLCRVLYTLGVGAVASKPAAARWAQQALDQQWHGLIERALIGKTDGGATRENDVDATVAMVELVAARFRAWQDLNTPR